MAVDKEAHWLALLLAGRWLGQRAGAVPGRRLALQLDGRASLPASCLLEERLDVGRKGGSSARTAGPRLAAEGRVAPPQSVCAEVLGRGVGGVGLTRGLL